MTREPVATHRIAHISDTHFTAGGAFHEVLRPAATCSAALAVLEGSGIPIDALVHTGDVADAGEPQAYVAARAVVDEIVDRTGWPVLWAAGNHDVREAMTEHLLGERPSGATIDRVLEVGGLRLISVDTSIPQHVEGGLDPEQLEWLAGVLTAPAEHGTVLVMHHAPVPVEITALQRLHLTGQEQLAEVLHGTDVRAILGGHLHYLTSAVFAGVPVHVAPALAYGIRHTRPGGGVINIDGGRAAGLLSLYDDGRVGWSAVPVDEAAIIGSAPERLFDSMGVDVER